MDIVRQLRRKKAWSQAHLAETAGVSKPTVQRVEMGEVIPSVETCNALAAVLDVDAQRIREDAGLVARLRVVAQIAMKREPLPRELAGLPPKIRRVVVRYSDACRAARRASDSVVLAAKELGDAARDRTNNVEAALAARLPIAGAVEADIRETASFRKWHSATEGSMSAMEELSEATAELVALFLETM